MLFSYDIKLGYWAIGVLFVVSIIIFFTRTTPTSDDPKPINKQAVYGNLDIRNSAKQDVRLTQEKQEAVKPASIVSAIQSNQGGDEVFHLSVEAEPHSDITGSFDSETRLYFESQEYDYEWAPEQEYAIAQTFYSNNLVDSDLQAVECRASLCKILIRHKHEQAKALFHSRLIAGIGDQKGRINTTVDDRGELVTTIFQYR